MSSNNALSILVVEDESFDFDSIKSNFSKAGYELDEENLATNVEAALDKIEATLPEIVLVDLILPRREFGKANPENGMDLIFLIKDRYPEISVAAITYGVAYDYSFRLLLGGISLYIKSDIKSRENVQLLIDTLKLKCVVYSQKAIEYVSQACHYAPKMKLGNYDIKILYHADNGLRDADIAPLVGYTENGVKGRYKYLRSHSGIRGRENLVRYVKHYVAPALGEKFEFDDVDED